MKIYLHIILIFLLLFQLPCSAVKLGTIIATFGEHKIRELTHKVDLKKGDSIHDGYTLYTNTRSAAVLLFKDNRSEITIKLAPATKMTIPTLNLNNKSFTITKLLEGSILCTVRKGSKFSVVTPNSIAGVAGTKFIVEYSKAKGTTLIVLAGKVKFASFNGMTMGQQILAVKNSCFKIDLKGTLQKLNLTNERFEKIENYWLNFGTNSASDQHSKSSDNRKIRNLECEGNKTLIIKCQSAIPVLGYFEITLNGYTHLNGKKLKNNLGKDYMILRNLEPDTYNVKLFRGGTIYQKSIEIDESSEETTLIFNYVMKRIKIKVNREYLEIISNGPLSIKDARGNYLKVVTSAFKSYKTEPAILINEKGLGFKSKELLFFIPDNGKMYSFHLFYTSPEKDKYQCRIKLSSRSPNYQEITLKKILK